MLKSLDVAIGLIVILLALSMAVTVITQSVTSLFNSRGRHLRRGLVDLLQQIDPGLTEAVSTRVATAVLTHPLVSGANSPWGRRLGNVVHREELTSLLMALASDSATLEDDAKQVLRKALAQNGISDPGVALKTIRRVAMELERDSPELSNATRQTKAVLQVAASDLVAKINGWFDQTMDRTAQRFTASTRLVTFANAFLVAFVLQVDTPMLVNRLAADDTLRNALVQKALEMPPLETPDSGSAARESSSASLPSSGASSSASSSAGASEAEMERRDQFDREFRDLMSTAGVITLPTGNIEDWWRGYARNGISGLAGMLITSLLLSLGAPFWYNALRNLLQLRSVLAVKDDAQRSDRQETEKPPAATAGT